MSAAVDLAEPGLTPAMSCHEYVEQESGDGLRWQEANIPSRQQASLGKGGQVEAATDSVSPSHEGQGAWPRG